MATEPSTDVSTKMITKDTEGLSRIQSIEDALAFLAESGIDVHSTEEFGDGFKVLDDKDILVKEPFVILGFRFHESERYNAPFVIIHAVSAKGKHIITDGSTGIAEQCRLYESKGITQGLHVPDGLIRSDYKYTDPHTGEVTPATTYYLS